MYRASFDKLIHAYGAAVDFSDMDGMARLMWQLPERYLRDAIAPAQHSEHRRDTPLESMVGYVFNGAFNAAIRHETGNVAVCIFAVYRSSPMKACRQVAARLELATGLPKCDAQGRLVVFDERVLLQSEWKIQKEPVLQAMEDFQCYDTAMPSENTDLAILMFDIAMRYVAMHECMHFVLGHARYCQRRLCLDSFADTAPERCQLDPVLSQTIEFIADRHVVIGLMHDLCEGRLFHEWSGQPLHFIAVESRCWWRRVLIATIALVFKLWRGHGSATCCDFSYPYPHPYERAMWMICALTETADADAKEDIDRSFALAISTLERNFVGNMRYVDEIERDIQMYRSTGISAMNRSYDIVRSTAMQIQKRLY